MAFHQTVPAKQHNCIKGLERTNKLSIRVLLGNGGVVEHGHPLNTQQQSQTPCDHVVQDNGAEGEREQFMRPRSHPQHMLQFFVLGPGFNDKSLDE